MQLDLDLGPTLPLGQCQHQARAEDIARRQCSRLRPVGQLFSLLFAQFGHSMIASHINMTTPNIKWLRNDWDSPLVISGYSEREIEAAKMRFPFLPKPFTSAVLIGAVRKVLGSCTTNERNIRASA